jgi:cardiolipin synthase
MNVPNLITFSRMLTAPFVAYYLLKPDFELALFVFGIAGFTDSADGFLARILNQRTKLGTYLDPAADKVLLSTCFVCAAIAGIVPVWLTVLVFTRDLVIAIGTFALVYIKTFDKVEVSPTVYGKLNTFLQFMTILYLLAERIGGVGISLPSVFIMTVMYITAALTLVSGVHYVFIGMRIYRTAPGV